MSRTYRRIPKREYEYTEEGFRIRTDTSYLTKVRDKDNHKSYTWNRPKWFTQILNRRRRSKDNQILNDFVNHSYNMDCRLVDEIQLTHKKEYDEYYW